MAKYGTYTIIIAIVLMLLPDILAVFGVNDVMTEPIYPIVTISLGVIGVLLHLITLILNEEFTLSGLILLSSVSLIIAGVCLSRLEVPYMEYLTLAGLLLIALWIAVPQNKQKKKADQE